MAGRRRSSADGRPGGWAAAAAILRRARVELRFLAAMWRANLQSALEYRAAFVSQVLGMVLNNAAFLAFWVLFFDRFPSVGGWGLKDMLQLFGMTATGFGLGVVLFGNALSLADIIAANGLDAYLVLPRPVLLHVLAGRSRISGLGDIATGIACVAATGGAAAGGAAMWVRFAVAAVLAMAVFVSFLVIVASLTFWLGGASALSAQAVHALLAFATYPLSIFDGLSKLMLLTVIPAAFIGAVPAAFVRDFAPGALAQLAAAALVGVVLAAVLFGRGVRRYESGGMAVAVG